VRSPRKWPGVSSLEPHLNGRPLVGLWFDRTQKFNSRRQRPDVFVPRTRNRLGSHSSLIGVRLAGSVRLRALHWQCGSSGLGDDRFDSRQLPSDRKTR
jgi:hypothetical protein